MNQADALEIAQSAVWTIIIASSPAVVAAMIIGVAIATLQAVTQIQEVTLTFIPKIVAILVVCAITGAFMASQIFAFTNEVYSRIASGF